MLLINYLSGPKEIQDRWLTVASISTLAFRLSQNHKVPVTESMVASRLF